MFESMAAFLLMEQQGGRVYAGRRGGTGYARTDSSYRKPYRTADGVLAVLLYTDAQWRSFFALVDRPDLAADPRLRTIRGRTEHIDELYRLVDTELARRSTGQWLTVLREHAIPAMPGAVATAPDVLRSGAPTLPAAPALGAHTAATLTALGLSEDGIRAATGVAHHSAGEAQTGPLPDHRLPLAPGQPTSACRMTSAGACSGSSRLAPRCRPVGRHDGGRSGVYDHPRLTW